MTTPESNPSKHYKHFRKAIAFRFRNLELCRHCRFRAEVIFSTFVPDSGFGTCICHVDRHGHFTLKQLRLPVLNETHTNSYLQILDYYMEMDFPGFIPKTKYIVPYNGTLFNLQGHIFLLQGHKVCQKTHCFNA